MRAVVLCALLLSGCIAPGRTVPSVPEGDWLVRAGDSRNAAYLGERVPRQIRIAWDEGFGRGLPAPPIIVNDLMVMVISGGGVVTASAKDGGRYWARRFNGSVAGQVLRTGDRLLFVTQHRNSTVYALDLVRGRRLWSRRLNARATAEPAFADGYLYVPTDRGEMLAVDAGTGVVVWRSRVGSQPAQPPLIVGGELLVAARDTLVRLERRHGQVQARYPIAAVPTAPLALRGDTVTIAMQGGIISAYAELGAREIWRHELNATVLAAPVVADDAVYVMTRDADLYRLGRYDSRLVAELDGAATESLTITASGALIGRLDGRIALIGFDGVPVWEEKLSGSIRAPAAVVNSDVYVGTLTGRMVKLTQ